VLITCYNKIDSVDGFMVQVHKLHNLGCQIVIVDDGSVDGSGERIRKEVSQLQNCKFVRQTNQGSAAARNRAIQEAERKFIQFLDLDDYLNIALLENLFSNQEISEDALSIFEYIRLNKPEFPKYSGANDSRNLSIVESEKELLGQMGYWRIIYPRKIILEHRLKFIPTFEDLGGKRFILDDLFWLIHLASIGIPCIKYNKEAISYGYVKNENSSDDDGNDFSNQASLFSLATSTFIKSLDNCSHPHSIDTLENNLKAALMFHSRYIRVHNLAFYLKNTKPVSGNLGIRKSYFSNNLLAFKLGKSAVIYSFKHAVRRLAFKNKKTRAAWKLLRKN
jgi:glycosyltransferase involved in cell wall biosynthesis